MVDPRARDVTLEQAKLDLLVRWEILRASGHAAPTVERRGDFDQSIDEWYDEQIALNEKRRLREKSERDRVVDRICEEAGAPSRADGNSSKSAAMQRLYALKGIMARKDVTYEVMDVDLFDPDLDDLEDFED